MSLTQNASSSKTLSEKLGGPILLPFSLAYPPYLNTRQRRAIYEAQIRGFIEAAEVVDLDDNILADILDGFEDFDVEDPPVLVDDGDQTLDVFGYPALMNPRWTPLEVRQMLKHLKERGMTSFVKEYVSNRKTPIPELLCAFDIMLCEELQKKKSETLLYFLRVALSRELQLRERLSQYNTIDDAIKLIQSSKRILILTGAGISVSCGIPDFRSRNGLYAQLKEAGQYDLDDPQEMFDIRYFRSNPAVFYSFAKQIYPSNFTPSSCHRFIKVVEDKGKLLRNYTQNIDTLETLAGVHNILQCHGSFATASCIECRQRVPGKAVEREILAGEVPICSVCKMAESRRKPQRPKRKRKSTGRYESDGEDDADVHRYPPWVMKPDITFFGEKLTDDFEKALMADEEKVDLILIIGTSLKVSPVADIINHLPHTVPQILINKTPVRHINPDIVLLGNADPIVEYLCTQLGWNLPAPPSSSSLTLQPLPRSNGFKRPAEVPDPERVGNSHVWLFEGADGGNWLQELREREEQGDSSDSEADDEDGYEPPPSSTVSSASVTPRSGTPREAKRPRMG